MMVTLLIVFLIVVIILGAANGGKEFGDTIRKGMYTLVILVLIAIAVLFVLENWDSIEPVLHEWMTV
jgi:uncharacterized membrane protein